MSAIGVSANRLEILQIAKAVAEEKSIDQNIVIEAMQEAIEKAAKAKYGQEHDIRATIDPVTGEQTLLRVLTVVSDEEFEDEAKQLRLAEATVGTQQLLRPTAQRCKWVVGSQVAQHVL